MPIPINVPRDDAWKLESVERPIGAYRFLTPLDVMKAGDLYRIFYWDGPVDPAHIAFVFGWSPIGANKIGQPYSEDKDVFEVIRPMDEAATTEPLFEVTQTS